MAKEETRKKDITPVVRSKMKEQNAVEKAASRFFSEDTRTVGDYVVNEKIIPAVKNGIVDALFGAIEMLFFGTSTGSRRTRSGYSGGPSYVSYSSYSSGNRRYDYHDDRMERDNRRRFDFSRLCNDDGTPYDRGQIERIISSMEELINAYGEASVADLFSICGVSGVPTDNYWGWRDCRDFGKRMYGRGYCLDFADPIDIRR